MHGESFAGEDEYSRQAREERARSGKRSPSGDDPSAGPEIDLARWIFLQPDALAEIHDILEGTRCASDRVAPP